MTQTTFQADLAKHKLEHSLHQATRHSPVLTIAKNAHVYRCGDRDEQVYFIESGQVKLVMHSPEKRECLLAIHGEGDIFGELCLSGVNTRLETATAMEDTVLKQIPRPKFFARLARDAQLVSRFVQYLTARVADQQQVIADLVTTDSEQRLGKTLLRLARTLGKPDAQNSIRIEPRITHEELSEMVGTTRPRVSVFMQRFRTLGLIETNAEHVLTIKEKRLTDYLAQIA
jgi:CRP/FNR family transcriptional regulator, cyclic AMP receptor protein